MLGKFGGVAASAYYNSFLQREFDQQLNSKKSPTRRVASKGFFDQIKILFRHNRSWFTIPISNLPLQSF